MTTKITLMFLAANTLVSLIIFIVTLGKNRRAAVGYLVLSLFIPVIGSLMCLIMVFPFRRGRYAIASEESIRHLKVEQTEYVDNDKLMNMVPANDALTLSNEGDRRSYLLGLLRSRDMESLRKILHKAVYNDDSEASHYAASAVMELQRISFASMEQASQAYVPGPQGSYTDAIRYAVAIMLYLENSEIGQLENYTFRQRYEEVMRDVMENHADECTGDDFENMTIFLEKQGRFDEAWQCANAYAEAFPRSETSYILMMQIACRQGNTGRFSEAYNRICSSETVLSSKGLATIRFWRPAWEGELSWTSDSHSNAY